METPFVIELTEHAMALRALARILVGERHADDLVQEVALQALQTAPPAATGIRGWLQVVLRRQASNLRRGEQRRQHREAATADRAGADAPAPVAIAEQHEMARRVTDLLLGLPEPYRDTLFRRFFHDATPAAIAASTNVPLATVKSRLQRGLAMLRERLDAGSRTDWRPALGAAFGLDHVNAIAPAKLAAGALLMGMGIKVWFTAAAAGLLGLLYLVASTTDPGLASGPTPKGLVTGAVPAAAAPQPNADAAPARSAAANASTAVAATATVRGRCVDENGRPLAGVLAGWQTIELSIHDRGMARSSTLTTGSDGAFEFAFDALAPVQWELSLQTLGRVKMRKTICAIPAGYVVELGAVMLPRGTQLTGRLVDRKGSPQANVQVLVGGRRADDFESIVDLRAETFADGTFAATENLPAGIFHLRIPERRGITPNTVTVDGATPTVYLDIVVDEVTAPMAMAGVVVDVRGQPVAGAEIRVAHEGFIPNAVVATTDGNGRFRLAREAEAPDAVPLQVRCDGYEPLRVEGQRWGRMDLELPLRSGVPVELLVTNAATGAPVETYEARFVRIENHRSVPDQSVRVRGRHEGGVARIAGLPRGSYRLFVVPTVPELAQSQFLPCVADDSGAMRLTVQIAARVERRVRAQFADGSPVAGSEVELVDPIDHDVDEQSTSSSTSEPLDTNKDTLWLADATTDAAGLAVLRGPADRPLALLVSGPSHLPTAVNRVTLASDEPLVVTVRRGASVRGRVQPISVLLEHANLAGFKPDQVWQEFAPRVMLVSADDQRQTPIERDGTFAFHALTAGTWHVRLEWPWREGNAVGWFDWPCPTSIDLAEEQDATLDLDVAPFALSTVQILVLHNGRPVGDQLVQLFCPTTWCNGEPGEHFFNARTDREGRCLLHLIPGRYSLGYPGPGFGRSIRAIERADVRAPGCVTSFTVSTGTVRLRLVQPDGQPVRGLTPMFRATDFLHQDTGSDENGVVGVVLPVGKFEIRIPRHAEADLMIGECVVLEDKTTEIELTVPPAARR